MGRRGEAETNEENHETEAKLESGKRKRKQVKIIKLEGKRKRNGIRDEGQ